MCVNYAGTSRSDLARQYRTKMSQMEIKRIETGRLNEEFEAKIRKKEVGFTSMYRCTHTHTHTYIHALTHMATPSTAFSVVSVLK